MKIEFLGKFSLRQREVIRVAAVVASANFPMPSRVRVYRLDRETRRENNGAALYGEIWLAGNIHGAALFSVASHEYRHISDLYIGKLEITHEAQYWNGRRVDLMAYTKRPHEKAAYNYERQLFPQLPKR